ncbi:unnamed protein product [Boreogadus saida]
MERGAAMPSPDQLTHTITTLRWAPFPHCPPLTADPERRLSPSQSRAAQNLTSQRSRKPKKHTQVKKLKYHQYIPPDQKRTEPPPQLDSSYAKILQQQQLFLQLQILNQQQQHYNYHTILPAPQPPTETARQQIRPLPPSRSSQTAPGGAKPSTLPANLDEFKVAELKQELKLRGLTVSGTKIDLIERLRNYQEQNGGGALKTGQSQPPQPLAHNAASAPNALHQSGEGLTRVPSFSLAQGPCRAVMRFGSTSSSVAPHAVERSHGRIAPDEKQLQRTTPSGTMVSSPPHPATLQHSPQTRRAPPPSPR